MTLTGEKINVRPVQAWSDQTGMDDSWLDNMWPESDVLSQIALQRAVDQQGADEAQREVVWSDATGIDDSWLDNLWPDSDIFVHVADRRISISPIARAAASDVNAGPPPRRVRRPVPKQA
jgi:hypothetical protein